MRKLLPKTSKNPAGFTLIELMIVITIMAILAIIAIAIYSGLQARARNAKRQGEVKALADALEVNKVPTSLTYPGQILSVWFPGSVIPNNFTGDVPHYVVLYTGTAQCAISAPSLVQWPATSAVPSGATTTCGTAPSIIDLNTVIGPLPGVPVTIVTFLVCALQESEVIGNTTRTAFCIPSAQ